MSSEELQMILDELLSTTCVDSEDVEDEVETAQRAVRW